MPQVLAKRAELVLGMRNPVTRSSNSAYVVDQAVFDSMGSHLADPNNAAYKEAKQDKVEHIKNQSPTTQIR